MPITTTRHALALATLAAAFIAAPLAVQAQTAKPAAKPNADAAYKAEVARCNSGQSQQDKATCLREAGAARDEARKGNLTTSGSADLAANATDRCKSQPAADQADCIKRITGAGNTSTQGSVGAGGVIRETVTPVKP